MSNSSSSGIGIGTILAVLIAWQSGNDLLGIVIRGLFGWFYVVYHVLTYGMPHFG